MDTDFQKKILCFMYYMVHVGKSAKRLKRLQNDPGRRYDSSHICMNPHCASVVRCSLELKLLGLLFPESKTVSGASEERQKPTDIRFRICRPSKMIVFGGPNLIYIFGDLTAFAVATEETDGYVRFMRSANIYGVHVKTLGLRKPWLGGNMKGPGGGYKLNLLRSALEPFKDDTTGKVILFTDSYDVIFLASSNKILDKFYGLQSRLVFAAEKSVWPDYSLESQFPDPESDSPYRYLNSGGIIGYAKDIYELLSDHPIENTDDDQLYLSKLYVNKELRQKYKMRLDYEVSIFQNLYGAEDDVRLMWDGGDSGSGALLENMRTNQFPCVLHGNGVSKLFLNSLGNYLAKSWDPVVGCTDCPRAGERLMLDGENIEQPQTPILLIAVFITYNTPFLEEFFEKLGKLNYPKDRIHLMVYNNKNYHESTVRDWVDQNFKKYLSAKEILHSDGISEVEARELALKLCATKKCDYLLSVDSLSHLDNEYAIRYLLTANKSIIAPLLVRPADAFSNFWGALNKDGFYARSFDYMDIIRNEKRGLWNVPYITSCYLIASKLLPKLENSYSIKTHDPDMSFAQFLRDKGIFMYVDNRFYYGHMISPDNYDISLTQPDLHQLFENRLDWEARYLHPNYSASLAENATAAQPCPDVFWFPLMSPRFCSEMINTCETYGQWSSGTNHDERLAGGYENVPTRDIHMNQVNFEREWLFILKEYVRPLQEKIFLGYFHDPPKSLLNFVVRYRPEEQPSLRPHHDSSTYTINLALNTPNLDYTGGGCRFIRYNCSVTDTKPGWILMHPGRLTHFHEGLLVTWGTRYILVSFIDP